MSQRFSEYCASNGLLRSVGRTGICFDNAMAESFFGALKNELVSRVTYRDRREATHDIMRYIELWYNTRRLHSSIGYRPPVEVRESYELAR
jgi:putative transposase